MEQVIHCPPVTTTRHTSLIIIARVICNVIQSICTIQGCTKTLENRLSELSSITALSSNLVLCNTQQCAYLCIKSICRIVLFLFSKHFKASSFLVGVGLFKKEFMLVQF